MKNVVEQFLLLSKENEVSKEKNKLEKYIRIFEPMIELMEHGIAFAYREHCLEVWDTCHVPIENIVKWADEFYEELQKEIAEGRLKLEDVDC